MQNQKCVKDHEIDGDSIEFSFKLAVTGSLRQIYVKLFPPQTRERFERFKLILIYSSLLPLF